MIMLKFNGINLFISWARIFIMNSKYIINISQVIPWCFFFPRWEYKNKVERKIAILFFDFKIKKTFKKKLVM